MEFLMAFGNMPASGTGVVSPGEVWTELWEHKGRMAVLAWGEGGVGRSWIAPLSASSLTFPVLSLTILSLFENCP